MFKSLLCEDINTLQHPPNTYKIDEIFKIFIFSRNPNKNYGKIFKETMIFKTKFMFKSLLREDINTLQHPPNTYKIDEIFKIFIFSRNPNKNICKKLF